MTAVLGLTLGAGLFLVWWSMWPPEAPKERRPDGWQARTSDLLVQAGAPAVTPAALVVTSAILAVVVALVVSGASGSPVIGAAFGVITSRAPMALVVSRASRRRSSMREVWPDAVDTLASGIRAGLSLPEAVGQLGDKGPETLRWAFKEFAEDFRATGRFDQCLEHLKARLADPVADRVIEALRLTREVGGTEVGKVLRTLAAFLRDDAKLRGELEARQSWTINAARLAVGAPWVVLAMLSTRPQNAAAYNSATGLTVLAVGGGLTVLAYRIMVRIGRLPEEARVLR